MWDVLSDPVYRRLFAAQLVALLGTGLATVALGLLAYDLAGEDASVVLGTVFTIKMVAYVGLSPLAGALAARLPRRAMLVALDLVRAAVALCLPFVTEIWQVYLLIFVLQAASAGFTPTFQATIPDVLADEGRYTRALSLSRLAYDLENIASPMLAAALLAVMSYGVLFLGTAAGFAASAVLVLSVVLPGPGGDRDAPFRERLTRGLRIYLATPRLRGLLSLNLVAAAGGAMVLVNTVVLVRAELGLAEAAVAVALAAFGAGSMAAALILPALLDRVSDRPVTLAGAGLMIATLAGLAGLSWAGLFGWGGLLAAWLLAGLGYGAVLTPAGRLLRRSCHAADRPAVFAAQFALSHACWLVTYPLAGWAQRGLGLTGTLILLAALALSGLVAALRLWPEGDPVEVPHRHDDLPLDHPHLAGHRSHAHRYVIDQLHSRWPGT